jgi:NarL family two-component system response regulator LiaR
MKTTRILLVEQDRVWKDFIQQHLSHQDDFHIIGCAVTKEKALEQFKNADLVLMDINLTGDKYEGIQLAVEMNQLKPTKIIMLTELEDKEIILEAFSAGVTHYIPKSSYRELPHVIRTVMKNNKPIEMLLDDYLRLKKDALLHRLTPAEREIFELLEQGSTQINIAQTLHKAESTIKNQVSSILKKMNARTSKQALEIINRMAK